MSSFLNAVFSMNLAVANTTLNTTPINDSPATTTAAITTVYYNPSFQAGTSPTTIPLPPPAAQGVFQVYIKNLDAANPVTLTYTAVGFSSTSIVIPPGGIFMYFCPETTYSGAAAGISALSVTAASAVVNCELFLGY